MQKDQSSFFAQHKNSPKRFQKDVKEKKNRKRRAGISKNDYLHNEGQLLETKRY